MRRYAANQVIFGTDKYLLNGVVEVEGDDVINYYAMDGEGVFTQWIGGAIFLSNRKNIIFETPIKTLKDGFAKITAEHLDLAEKLYAWHIDEVDFTNGIILPSAKWQRLTSLSTDGGIQRK